MHFIFRTFENNLYVSWKNLNKKLKNYLQKVFASVVFVVALFSGMQKVFASHSMGADLTYKCLGGNTYELSLSFYRDCVGIIPADSVIINVSSSCFGRDTVLLVQVPGTGQEITPICSSELTTCNGGRFTGIQEFVYKGTVTLPGVCTDWTFGYDLCCRNWAITNIDRPTNTMMYVFATLNNTDAQCNNSPTFSNKPVPFACLGQQFCFNHGAHDADGDSLVYSMITPFSTYQNPIQYRPPFTATNPLTSVPAVSFNSMTGDICMTPAAPEVTVMAVLVKEYRNGILIGSVERDIQVTVINCNNELPKLTGIDSTNTFSETICAGTQTCFNIFSSDADTNQNTTIDWDHSIAGGTLTVFSGARAKASFCWTPDINEVRTNPYCFTVTVRDDNCPYNGSQVYSYCITVNGIRMDGGPDQSVGCNAFTTLNVTASGGSGNYTYQWNTGESTASISGGPGMYVVNGSDGMCSNKDTVQVLGGSNVPVSDFAPLTTCSGTLIQFNDLSQTNGSPIANWHWNFGDNDTSTTQNPVHSYLSTGSYSVSLIVASAAGCIDTLTRTLNVNNDQPASEFLSYDVCLGTPINFTDQSNSPVAVTNWLWKFGDAISSTIPSPAHNFTLPGNYQVTLTVTNSSGCVDSISHAVTVHPAPPANAGDAQSICEGSSATLTARGGILYSWFPGGLTDSSIVVTPPSTQIYSVTVTDGNDCYSVARVTVTVHPNPAAYAGPDKIICRGTPVTLAASGGGNYLWDPAGLAIPTQQITVTPLSSRSYTVLVTNNFGCQSSDVTNVVVNDVPVAGVSSNRSVCFGDRVNLQAFGGGDYIWFPGGDTTASLNFVPQVSTLYHVVVSNAAGCNDTAQVSVVVNPVPVASFASPPLICEGTNIQLTDGSLISSGTISGRNWSFGDNTFSSLQQTSVLYHDTGSYHIRLIVTSNASCRDTSDAVVEVAAVPQTSFHVSDRCLNQISEFTNTSFIISGESLIYQWNLGDNSFTQTQNPSHTYNAPGLYNVSLISISERGCRDTVFHSTEVHPLPVAAFRNVSVCEDAPFVFSNSSTILSDLIQSWNWNFGDAASDTAKNPSHVYSNPGVFPVKLIAKSNFGCVDSVTHDQRIFPKPVPDFIGEQKCLGDQIQFSNLSSISSGSIVFWQWDLGDYTIDNSFSPAHFYSHPGSYNVMLSAISDSGCEVSVTLPAIAVVHPLPQASFVPNAASVEEFFPFVTLINQSTEGVNNFWNFGDSTFSTDVQPEHVFHATGYFVVQLIVMDHNGCRDTTYSTVEVKPSSSIFIPNAFSPNGDGVNDTFHPLFIKMTGLTVVILDRWGKRIAEWNDLNGSWDGFYNGSPAQADVYVYHFECTDVNGKKEERIGHVTLVR